ncbi:MAG: hypothetical protein PGN22_14440 [Agrobacterium cavarae]|uniref:hypothetical protein n=1 Tax=Agrobacterium cavarae TaxID=2528239 RepID=UPI000DCFDF78|nr:hypothetical protein [Agrobacterium cavarae]
MSGEGSLDKIQFERWVLFIVGLAFLAFALIKVNDDRVLEAGGIATIAIMCLVFSNLTRFKKFKGLGFEAELWEEKQQEAADLIDLFKTYTSEIVMNSVMQGRWDDGGAWGARWKLFNELTSRKPIPGVDYDFTDLRKAVEDMFIFDMCMNLYGVVRNPLDAARLVVSNQIVSETDLAQNFEKQERLNSIKLHVDQPLEACRTGNLAKMMLEVARVGRLRFHEEFGVEVEFDEVRIERLKKIAEMSDKRPLQVTDELIRWADHQEE